ncbi:unnamed protein product [Eruca vesicaria subsp. sativa]|uniref:UDP-glycosyltransferases domain-containing protein n=1 Tax=Eruca vesicaria subsp. sativa TaxID=29727 RepID=A0ABC8M4R4_ERUVS|nr:unnamed protein product [Eruca vesicaria subsp. sativa]
MKTEIDWIPSINTIQLKDFPDFIIETDHQHLMLNFITHVTQSSKRASAIIINTFENLEHDVVSSLQSILHPRIYPIGPLPILENRAIKKDSEIGRLRLNLFEEETESLINWLDTKGRKRVVYVNFGSITVLTREQVLEFARGLAMSGKEFLWVVRSDLPAEFLSETVDRGKVVTGWCCQEEVISHPAIGAFLTHCGWNSTVESVVSGVPMICWPFFADQLTNMRFCCGEWGLGVEIGGEVRRERVEAVVREVMDGVEVRENVEEWRWVAEEASVSPCGSSFVNFETVVNEVLMGDG